MSDLLNEVLKDHSDEQNLKKFKFILPIVIIGTIFLAIIMYFFNYYNASRHELNARNGNVLYQIVHNDDIANVVDEHLITTNELIELQKISKNINNIDIQVSLKQLENIVDNQNFKNETKLYARLLILALITDKAICNKSYNVIFEQNMQFFQKENDLFYGYANLLYTTWLIYNQQIDQAVLILNNLILSSKIPSALKEQAKAIQFNINNKFLRIND